MESMECSAVECNGMESMEWSAVEWNVRDKIDLVFFGQSDNFHFSKVAIFVFFLPGAFENGLKKRRATKLPFLKMRLYLGFLMFFVAF